MIYGNIKASPNRILTLEHGKYIVYRLFDPASVVSALAILKARGAEIRFYYKSGRLYDGKTNKEVI